MTDLPPELEALFRKALKAAHRKGLRAGRAEVLAGLKAVAKLNGSAPDVVRHVHKATPPARHPLDIIGDAVLEALGVEAKAFDESKHPRDHGRFASEPGAEGEPEESAPSHPKAAAAARRIAQHIGAIAARLNAAVLSAGLTPEDAIGSQEDWLRIWSTHHADVVAHALGVDAMTAAHILTHLAARAIGLAREHLGWGKAAKGVVFKGFDADAHPRDDAGRFISKEDIEAAKSDPAKAAELRGRVKPGDEGKLDAALAAAGEPAPTKEEPSADVPREWRDRLPDPDAVAAAPKTKKAREELVRKVTDALTEARNALVAKYGTRNIEDRMTPEERKLNLQLLVSRGVLLTGRERDGVQDLGPVSDQRYAGYYRGAVQAIDQLRASAAESATDGTGPTSDKTGPVSDPAGPATDEAPAAAEPAAPEPAATPVEETAARFDRHTPEELLDLSKRLAERLAALRPQPEEHHAPETGQLEGGDLPEHQDRGGGGQAAEAGGGDRAEHGAGAEGRPEEEVKPAVAKPARPKPQPKPPAGDPAEHAAALAKARDAALSAVSRGKIGKAAEYDPAPLRAAYDAAAKQPKPVLLRILLAITGTAGDPQMAAYYGKMSAAKLAAALFDHTIGRVEARQRADM